MLHSVVGSVVVFGRQDIYAVRMRSFLGTGRMKAVFWESLISFVGLVTLLLTSFLLITPPLEVGGGAASSPLEFGGGNRFSLLFEGLAWPFRLCCAWWRGLTAVGLESSGCAVIGGWSLVWCSKSRRGVSTLS